MNRRCSACRHWINSQCRRTQPTANAEGKAQWPITAADDWCGSFTPSVQAVGHQPKVSDEYILKALGECTTDPIPGTPPSAVLRSMFVNQLIEAGMTRTPALKRLTKLIRLGLVGEGPNPFYPEAKGIHLWKIQAPEAAQPEDRQAKFLTHLRVVAPFGQPQSMRQLVRTCGLGISVPTGARWLNRLIADGLAINTGSGYSSAPIQEVE